MPKGWRRSWAVPLGLSVACCALALAPAASAAVGDPWVQAALDDQYELAHDVPLADAPWVGTHNSFNSIAEMGPTLSALDANQLKRIKVQLDVGVRSIELDLHWIPGIEPIPSSVVVCHGRGPDELNFGCTAEKSLKRVLKKIVAWLQAPGHSEEVLLVYLEDDMGGSAPAHDAAAAVLRAGLGDLAYRPPAGGCSGLPISTLAREDVLAAGAQVVLVSGCGTGAAWRGEVFNWNSAKQESRPLGFRDYPDCGPDFTRAQYDTRLIRYFEDTTYLTNGIGPLPGAGTRDERLTPSTTAAMMRCGVDLTGFDKLKVFDARLAAAVWSWAPGQPSAGGTCAVQQNGAATTAARWFVRDCGDARRPACRNGAAWGVGPNAVPAALAEDECAAIGAVHAVPRSGYEAQLLREAALAAGAAETWLGYRSSGGDWVALDDRS